MNKVTDEVIKALLDSTSPLAISIYMPTHRHPTSPFMQEDQTRYKNILRTAREKFAEHGGDSSHEPVFGELEAKLDDLEFWQNTIESLAIFIADGKYQIYHLPLECEERVGVGDSFDITPLLVVQGMNQSYYLLAIAMHDPKLFKGDMYGVEPVEIDFPTSPEDALNIDEMFINSRTVKSAHADGASNPHGEGDSSEAGREELHRYYTIVEEMISSMPDYDTKTPILVAGADSEAGDFRAKTKLPGVLKDCYIQGNQTEATSPELHRLADEIIFEQCVLPRWQAAVERYNETKGTGKSSDDLDDIETAASAGRVDTLIVATLDETRDSISDAVTKPTLILRRPDESILDRVAGAARDVACQSGVVLGMKNEGYLDDGVQVAAVYRY